MGDSNDMILVCDGPVKHCRTGRWQLGHICTVRTLTTVCVNGATFTSSKLCGATIGRVKWNAALRPAAKLGGADAVEAMLNA